MDKCIDVVRLNEYGVLAGLMDRPSLPTMGLVSHIQVRDTIAHHATVQMGRIHICKPGQKDRRTPTRRR